VGDEMAGVAGGMSPGRAGRFAPGSRVARYLLEEQIGRGGMAVVFRAHDAGLDRRVALKILGPEVAESAGFRQRFIRESRAAAAVDDPHIIPVFEAGEADGLLFIAMRLVLGGDVGSLIRTQGPLAPARAAWIVSGVASALDAAHAYGLVHRDVKPGNMLLDARPGRPDHVYLSDFGLSKAWQASTALTGTGLFLGTVDYAAPEQIQGRAVDGRSDQYALGCAAFELLAGEPPFRQDEAVAVMYAQLSAPPPPLAGRQAGLPPAVDAVFARVLAKSPDERYGSCGEFADALRSALGLGAYESGSQDIQQDFSVRADAPTVGQPSEDQPTEGQTSEGQTSEGQPSEDQPSEDQPAGRSRRRRAIAAGAVVAVVGLLIAIAIVVTRPGTALTVPGLRWSYTTAGKISSSPVVAGGIVYIGSDDDRVYALDAATGVVRWTYTTAGNIFTSSPAVAGGTVYIGSQDEVYALDAATGAVRWIYTAAGPVDSSPVLADGTVYIGSNDKEVYALDAATGHRRWAYATAGIVFSSAVVTGGTVYIGSGDDDLYALDAATGHRRWSYPTRGKVFSRPAVSGGIVYVGSDDHKMYALDAVTGRLRWSYTTAGKVASSPVVAGGVVYFGSNDHKVYALDAMTGRVRWSYTTGGKVFSSPVVSGGVVYIGSNDDKVYALDAATGHKYWAYATGGSVDSSPAVKGGIVYIGSSDHKVYALTAKS
jgi:serine/threonine protein kinase